MPDFRRLTARLSLRLRLTLWYVALLAMTLLIFSGYIYWRFHNSVMGQVDVSLKAIASQALVNVDPEGDRGIPAFQHTEEMAALLHQTGETDIIVRLLSPTGKVWDGVGYYRDVPVAVPGQEGFSTFTEGDERTWRVYSLPLRSASGATVGWLQTIQRLDTVARTLEGLREQFYWGIPLALLLTALGGFFLADRALRPIDRITRTAYAISASDLSRRIHYHGTKDELGRLADTFDAMLDRLQAAFEHERRFTDDAAHELRTPLTILKGQLGVTLSRPRSPAEYERTLRGLEQEVDRLIRLSTDLLFLSRLDQGRVFWRREPMNLSDLLHVAVEQIGALAAEKDVALSDAVEEALWVRGDQDHLIRLFLNLLDNALKYTPAGGKVQVMGRRAGAWVEVAVRDSGPGIPAEALPHLFDRFFRVDADRSRRTGGAGLGLAIAREIVRRHGGTLTVQSREGEGTTFIVRLPAETSAPQEEGR